jgi:hypothetical protein
MAERTHGRVTGLHVIDIVSIEGSFMHDISGSLGFEPYLDFSAKMREALRERGEVLLDAFDKRCRERGVVCDRVLAMGIVANEICEHARIADLVAIGIAASTSSSRPGSSAPRPSRSRGRARSPSSCRRCASASRSARSRLRRLPALQPGHARGRRVRERLQAPLTVFHVARDESEADEDPGRARRYLEPTASSSAARPTRARRTRASST